MYAMTSTRTARNTKRRVFFHHSRDFSRRASRLNAKDSFCKWSVLVHEKLYPLPSVQHLQA